MNEAIEVILKRYSCRSFTGEALTDDQLQTLAKAALAAPSAMNRQPWHIIIVTDKALIDELDGEGMRLLRDAADPSGYERIQARGGKMLYNAPCMVIAASGSSPLAAMDCGILSQNVTLAACALGLGSVICGMAGIPLSGPRGTAFKQRLQFPEGYDFSIAILVGAATTDGSPHPLDWAKLTYVKG